MGSFVFPFAVALQAVAAMEDLATQLRTVVSTHDDALAVAHQDFQGETRDQLDRDFAGAMDALLTFARYLDGDAAELQSTIARAQYLDAQSQASPP